MTALSYTKLPINAGAATPAGTALAATMTIANADPEHTVLIVTNSGGAALTATVAAGDNPPALDAAGALAVSVAASGASVIGPLESGRFIKSDGSLSVGFSATTGTVTAYQVAKH